MSLFTDPSFGPFLTFFLISFFVSLAITIVYKFTTNQRLMKQLRDDIKKYQEQLKKAKDTKKMMEVQKKAMDVNMQYMMHSMRPTLFTLLPILLIFGWVAGNLSFQQIAPGEQFQVDVMLEKLQEGQVSVSSSDLTLSSPSSVTVVGGVASFNFSGQAGDHMLRFSFANSSVDKQVIIATDWRYAPPLLDKEKGINGFMNGVITPGRAKIPQDAPFASVKVIHKPVRPLGSFALFGYRPGWVATYIVLSLIFSLVLRKVMNLH